MKTGSTNTKQRSRGRVLQGGNSNKKHTPLRNQTFDSNGPDVRIRGNAHQVYEKYLSLARDATAQGDRVAAENYFQHAEHYYRIINAHTPVRTPKVDQGSETESGEAQEGQSDQNDSEEGEVSVVTDVPDNGNVEAGSSPSVGSETVENPQEEEQPSVGTAQDENGADSQQSLF